MGFAPKKHHFTDKLVNFPMKKYACRRKLSNDSKILLEYFSEKKTKGWPFPNYEGGVTLWLNIKKRQGSFNIVPYFKNKLVAQGLLATSK